MIPDIKKLIKNIKQHMSALTAGICCWLFIWYISGTSCWIRSVFGIPCPGCGSTRAVAAIIFHGDLKEAMRLNPLIFITAGLIIFAIFVFMFKITINKPLTIMLLIILASYLAVYIARMIMFFPHTEPMTYLESSMLGRFINLIKLLIKLVF